MTARRWLVGATAVALVGCSSSPAKSPASARTPSPALTPAALTGRWIPADHTYRTHPQVVFVANGRYNATDGCNSTAGRWVMGPGGEFVATGGS